MLYNRVAIPHDSVMKIKLYLISTISIIVPEDIDRLNARATVTRWSE